MLVKLAKWMLALSIALLLSLLFLVAVLIGHLCVSAFPFFILSLGSIVLLGLIITYATTSRRMIASYVLSTIGSSMRQNLPLPMALESAASGQTDKRARILRSIQKWLVQGYSLSESIKRGYPACPGYALATIAAAERIDQLPLAIRSIEADIAAKAQESRRIRPVDPLYPIILIVFAFLVVLALMTYVVPQLVMVLEELVEGAQLPGATRFLMRIVGFVAWDIGSVLLVMFGLALVVGVPIWLRTRFRSRRPLKPYLFSRIGDFVKWHLPILHWFEKNYSMVQVVEVLRLSLNAGCAVDNAIANTLNLDVNNRFRKRLRTWLERVQAGHNIAAAARQSKLGSPLVWAFDEQVNPGSNTLTILEALESFYRSNYSYYVNLVRFILYPCVTLTMGAMVGFVVYAVFSALVRIITITAGLVYP
jgi:general secretion pathway protein F